MMHGRARKLFADGFKCGVAFGAFLAANFYLDQLVSVQIEINFFQDGRSKSLVSNQDDWVQWMGGST